MLTRRALGVGAKFRVHLAHAHADATGSIEGGSAAHHEEAEALASRTVLIFVFVNAVLVLVLIRFLEHWEVKSPSLYCAVPQILEVFA